MVKIYLKLALITLMTFVFALGVCGADSLAMNGHWFLLICMIFIPSGMALWACNNGKLDDVLEWCEKLEDNIKQ